MKRSLDSDDHCTSAWNKSEKQDMASSSIKHCKMRHVTSQPLAEQGWRRCQAGFDGISLLEEEEVKCGRSHHTKRGGVTLRRSLESAVDKDQGSSLDIDWSSSSDSLSDIEPLIPSTSSKNNSRRSLPRVKRPRKHFEASKIRKISGDGDVEILEKGFGDVKWSSRSEREVKQLDISDYESHEEDTEQTTTATNSQQASSLVHISDQSPTPQPSPDQNLCDKTGTEVLKKLKLPSTTPEKDDATGGRSGSGDSAKKKRFIRGGLAERLQRVINREKSATAFWAHRTADAIMSQNPTLDVHILSIEEVKGLFITRCQTGSLPTGTNKEMFVLFTQSIGRQLKLGVGSRVTIHPPWQKLTLANYDEPVILCTYFCQPLGDGDEAEAQSDVIHSRMDPMLVAATPSKMQLKPLQLFKPSTSTIAKESRLQSTCLSQPVEPVAGGHVSDSFLDSIAHSAAYSVTGMCVRARIHRVYCRRCSEQSQTPSRTSLGIRRTTKGCALGSTQWAVLLQDNKGVFSELQVTLGSSREEDEENWRRSLRQGEGRAMVFAGLKVMRRVSRTRSPGFFSLIDSLWSPSDVSTSQSETESQDFRPQQHPTPQSFCYILGVQTLRNTIQEEVPDRVTVPYREPVIHTLRDIQQMADTSNQRVSFYAKVVYAHSETDIQDGRQSPWQLGSGSVWHLFVTDHSLSALPVMKGDDETGSMTGTVSVADQSVSHVKSPHSRLLHVQVRASCYLSESVEEGLVSTGCLVFIRDLCLGLNSNVYADMYTTIKPLEKDASTQSVCAEPGASSSKGTTIINTLSQVPVPKIPTLSLQSEESSLVSVSGVVIGVDETTAYSWPACDTCGNNRLEAHPSNSASQLHCGICQRFVTSPLTRMHLELFLHCLSLEDENASVKVQLQQQSIEKVLPPLSSQEDGYDLQCILGVDIGPISCFLKAIARQPGEPITFELEEVSLESS